MQTGKKLSASIAKKTMGWKVVSFSPSSKTDLIRNCVINDKNVLPTHLTQYLREIALYQIELDDLPEEDYSNRIYIMSKMLVFIGEVVAYTKGEARRKYNERKRVYSETYLAATSHRQHMAEIAVIKLREEEAEWLERSERWNNIFESVTNEMQALKYKQKVAFADGSAQAY